MANIYRVVDEKYWERTMHCTILKDNIGPTFCVTSEVDITNFLQEIKRQDFSFALAMAYAVCKCTNEIEAFRYRLLDGTIILYDRIDTTFTYLNQDTQSFKMVNIPVQNKIEEYMELVAKTAREQKECFTGSLGNDVFQCSLMP